MMIYRPWFMLFAAHVRTKLLSQDSVQPFLLCESDYRKFRAISRYFFLWSRALRSIYRCGYYWDFLMTSAASAHLMMTTNKGTTCAQGGAAYIPVRPI